MSGDRGFVLLEDGWWRFGEPVDQWGMARSSWSDRGDGLCAACGRPRGGHAGGKCYPRSAGDLGLGPDFAPSLTGQLSLREARP